MGGCKLEPSSRPQVSEVHSRACCKHADSQLKSITLP